MLLSLYTVLLVYSMPSHIGCGRLFATKVSEKPSASALKRAERNKTLHSWLCLAIAVSRAVPPVLRFGTPSAMSWLLLPIQYNKYPITVLPLMLAHFEFCIKKWQQYPYKVPFRCSTPSKFPFPQVDRATRQWPTKRWGPTGPAEHLPKVGLLQGTSCTGTSKETHAANLRRVNNCEVVTLWLSRKRVQF